jgi:cytochrome c55X
MSGTCRRLVWSLPGLALAGTAIAAGIPPNARQVQLINLVRQDCGSCHGMTLKGGLGPALLPANLAAKDRASLTYTILYGRPGTPMPPWKDFVSEDEAAWIVDRLMDGFPDAR